MWFYIFGILWAAATAVMLGFLGAMEWGAPLIGCCIGAGVFGVLGAVALLAAQEMYFLVRALGSWREKL